VKEGASYNFDDIEQQSKVEHPYGNEIKAETLEEFHERTDKQLAKMVEMNKTIDIMMKQLAPTQAEKRQAKLEAA